VTQIILNLGFDVGCAVARGHNFDSQVRRSLDKPFGYATGWHIFSRQEGYVRTAHSIGPAFKTESRLYHRFAQPKRISVIT
jgi:hypothetical protein